MKNKFGCNHLSFSYYFKSQKLPEKSCKDEPRGCQQISVLLTVINLLFIKGTVSIIIDNFNKWQINGSNITKSHRNIVPRGL